MAENEIKIEIVEGGAGGGAAGATGGAGGAGGTGGAGGGGMAGPPRGPGEPREPRESRGGRPGGYDLAHGVGGMFEDIWNRAMMYQNRINALMRFSQQINDPLNVRNIWGNLFGGGRPGGGTPMGGSASVWNQGGTQNVWGQMFGGGGGGGPPAGGFPAAGAPSPVGGSPTPAAPTPRIAAGGPGGGFGQINWPGAASGAGVTPRPAAGAPGSNFAGQLANIGAGGAGGAGGGAAGAAGMAEAAAGPIGLAIAVGQAVQKKLLETIETIGKVGEGIASLDPYKMVEGVNSVLEKLGPMGELMAGANKALFGMIRAVGATSEKLAEYNGQLAMAQAQANIRQIQGDIRRADLLAKELSAFTEAQSRFEQAGQDVLAQLLKPLIPPLTAFLNGAATALESISSKLDAILRFLRINEDNDNRFDLTSDLLGSDLGAGAENWDAWRSRPRPPAPGRPWQQWVFPWLG